MNSPITSGISAYLRSESVLARNDGARHAGLRVNIGNYAGLMGLYPRPHTPAGMGSLKDGTGSPIAGAGWKPAEGRSAFPALSC